MKTILTTTLLFLALFVAQNIFADVKGSIMLSDKKYAAKSGNDKIDIYINAEKIKKSYEDICIIEVHAGYHFNNAMNEALKEGRKKGADAFIIITADYFHPGGSGGLWSALIVKAIKYL